MTVFRFSLTLRSYHQREYRLSQVGAPGKERLIDMPKIEDIYASMIGELIVPVDGICDEYAPGSYCDRLYTRAAIARTRLCRRLGVDDDPDLEVSFDSFCDINSHLCRKMFEYGHHLGTH